MKVSNAFGVGTARYVSTHAPFLVEDPTSAIIDVPLCCGIVRWDMHTKTRLQYIDAHTDSITCLISLTNTPYSHSNNNHNNSTMQTLQQQQHNVVVTASFSGEVCVWFCARSGNQGNSKWEKKDTYKVRLGKVMHISTNYDVNKVIVSSEQSGGCATVLSLSTDGKLSLDYEIAGDYMFCEFNSRGDVVAISHKSLPQPPEIRSPKWEVSVVLFDIETAKNNLKSADKTVTVTPKLTKILPNTDSVNLVKRNKSGLLGIVRTRNIYVINPDTLEVDWCTNAQGSGGIKDFIFYNEFLLTPEDNGTLTVWHKTTKIYSWKVSIGVVYSMDWATPSKSSVWICDESGIHLVNLKGLSDKLHNYRSNPTQQQLTQPTQQTQPTQPTPNQQNEQIIKAEPVADDNLITIRFHEMTCCGLDFSERGDYVVSGDFGGQILLWQSAIGGDRHTPLNAVRLMYPVRSLAWRKSTTNDVINRSNTDDPQPVMIGLVDGSIYSWQPFALESVPESVAMMTNAVTCMTWESSTNPDRLAASSTDGALAVFQYSPGETLLKTDWAIKAHKPSTGPQDMNFGSLHKFAEIWSICWSPDNLYLASASEDQKTRIWTSKCGDFITELSGHTSAVTCVDWQYTKYGNLLATSGDDRTVRVWDSKTWNQYHIFETTEIDDWHTATYLAIEANGTRIACVTQNGWLVVWNLGTKAMEFCRRLHLGSIEGLKWHPSTGCIATCASDCVINIVDTK